MKKNTLYILSLIGILLISYFIGSGLSGGDSRVDLKVSPISYLIAQTLEASENSTKLPIEGVDYTLGKIKYFDGDNWLVVPIIPINNSANGALIVINKQAASYRVVLGPGSEFSGVDLDKVPTDVAKYLENGS